MAQSYWILLFFHFIIKGVPKCFDELNSCETEDTQAVSAALGKTTELPCSVSIPRTAIQQYRMRWYKYASAGAEPCTVQAWPKPLHSPETRPFFLWGEEGVKVGNLSLSLSDVRNDDSGTYTCEVWIGWNCLMRRTVNLKVKECEVLNAITALHKTTVILPCYQGNTPTPKVSWFSGPLGQDSLILQHPPTQSSLNSIGRIPLQGRARFSGDLKSGNASLSISELNFNDANWYRCRLHTGEKTEPCQEMRLDVRDLPGSEVMLTTSRVYVTVKANGNISANEDTSQLPVAVVASVLSVCAAVAMVGACIRYRKGTNSAEDDFVDRDYANMHNRNSAFLPSTLYTVVQYETE